jgi:RNA 2',3'-cyclic 3'-phosphodiesterase
VLPADPTFENQMTDRSAFSPADPEQTRHRIFIAVPLADGIRAAAGQARRPLAAYGDRLRWVEPAHLHLTLHFLGNISTAMVAEAVAAAEETAGPETAFSITFAGLGAFPSAASARVVWVGVTDGADRLTALAARLGAALRGRRFTLEDRPFAAHLTLARVRGTGRPPDLRRETEAMRRIVLGEQCVTEVVVVKSVLGASAPTHTVVARAALSNALTNTISRPQDNREKADGTS